jgi:hypothetical protein
MAENEKSLGWLGGSPIQGPDQDELGYGPPAIRLAKHLNAVFSAARSAPGSENAMTVAVEGAWGSGKTSYTNLVAHFLKEQPPESREESDEERDKREQGDPVVVRFNVWLAASLQVDPWYALAYRIGEAFYRRFHHRCIKANQEKKSFEVGHPRFGDEIYPSGIETIDLKPDGIHEQRLHWLEVALRLSEGIKPADHWHPCLKLFCEGASSKLPGRSLAIREGLRVLTSLGGAALSTSVGQIDKGIGGAVGATQQLLEKRLTEGPAWGKDPAAFFRDLDRLLFVLHPKPKTWRMVLILDDLARLNAGELPGILDILGHLDSLNDVVTLLNVDNEVSHSLRRYTPQAFQEAGESSAGRDRSTRSSESFMDRLIHLRVQVPTPQNTELMAMLRRHMMSAFGLTLPQVRPFLRTFLEEERSTPRLTKKAFHWLLLRYPENFPNEVTLRLLLDFFWHSEGKMPRADLLANLAKSRRALRQVEVQPWDVRAWIDTFGISKLGDQWTDVASETEDLILAIRHGSVVAYLQRDVAGEYEDLNNAIKQGRQSWQAWHQALLAKGLLANFRPNWDIPFENFLDMLTEYASREGVVPWVSVANQLTAAARHSRFVSGPMFSVDFSKPLPQAVVRRLLGDYFFDHDVLTSVKDAEIEGDTKKEWNQKAEYFAGFAIEYNFQGES